jgi:hypothetical protein
VLAIALSTRLIPSRALVAFSAAAYAFATATARGPVGAVALRVMKPVSSSAMAEALPPTDAGDTPRRRAASSATAVVLTNPAIAWRLGLADEVPGLRPPVALPSTCRSVLASKTLGLLSVTR